MRLQPRRIHAFAVIEDDDRRSLIVEIRCEQYCNPTRSSVERVGDQLFYSFIRTRVKAFGKQTNDAIAESHINFFSFTPRSRVYRIYGHCSISPPHSRRSATHLRNSLCGLLSLLRRYQTLIIVRLLQAVSCWLPSVILSLQSMMIRFNLMWGSTSTSNFASMLRDEANASLAIVWA